LPPVADPLGLSNLDLRQTQDLYSSGLLQRSSIYARRNTAALLNFEPANANNSNNKHRQSRATMSEATTSFDEEDEDEEDDVRGVYYGSTEKR
jgi:hypothetical protein